MFWSYLWGFETRDCGSRQAGNSAFWSYLWGFETSGISTYPWAARQGFGVTYEGLKPKLGVNESTLQFWFWSYLWGFETRTPGCGSVKTVIVLELPMRVWNNACGVRFTSFIFVLELPMRVWNFSNSEAEILPCKYVLELPMRVWNYLMSIRLSSRILSCFGVTYEGLKLTSVDTTRSNGYAFWSYLWGFETQDTCETDCQTTCGFGVTYEGLKLWFLDCVEVVIFVLELPMRVWNYRSVAVFFDFWTGFGVTYEGLKLVSTHWILAIMVSVLELPMRVWNVRVSVVPLSHWLPFWSYLWGFETLPSPLLWALSGSRFGVTYEGLKHLKQYLGLDKADLFWSYLWGFETSLEP